MPYSVAYKERMVRKMAGPVAMSANALARETGVHQATLSRWLREASKVSAMAKQKQPRKSRRPQDWPAEEKLEVVLAAAAVSEDELGEFLRRRGVREAHLEKWRRQMLGGLQAKPARSSGEARRIRDLEREVHRKDKALAETAALLVLKKKADAIWGDADDATPRRSGK